MLQMKYYKKVLLHLIGVLLWSQRSIEIDQERCREDILYLDATVATYLTCDHTTIDAYYRIASGTATKKDFGLPVLHRCLSHVMKNAKDVSKVVIIT
ncbi:unnamed protein product [Arctogadus glacialis]